MTGLLLNAAWWITEALSLLFLAALLLFAVCCVIGDRRRAQEKRRADADVALARSRQIPYRLIDQWTSDDDEALETYLRRTP